MAKEITPLDVFILHQLYVEGYKNGQDEETKKTLDAIIALLILMLIDTGYENVSDMPKRIFNKFVTDFNRKFNELFHKFEKNLVNNLKKLFVLDFDMNKAIFKKLGGKTYTGTPAGKLWGKLLNTPTAVGDEPKSLFTTFVRSASKNITNVFKRAYVDKLAFKDIIIAIKGTKELGFKNGLLNKLGNQLGATVETYIQRIVNFVLHTIGGALYETYQWVSVLDSATTDICRSRDGNIYRYGDGPVPPAHYRCRSTIVPVIITATADMPTFAKWLPTLPAHVRQDVFGKRRAGAANGSFSQIKSLTLDDFSNKRKILTNLTEKSA